MQMHTKVQDSRSWRAEVEPLQAKLASIVSECYPFEDESIMDSVMILAWMACRIIKDDHTKMFIQR